MRKYKFLIVAVAILLVVMSNTMTYANPDIEISISDISLDSDNIRYEVFLESHNSSLNEQVIIVLDEGLEAESIYETNLISGRAKRSIDFNEKGSKPSTV